MRRRDFVALAGGAVIAWPFVAKAQQQTATTPRIAYLGASRSTLINGETKKDRCTARLVQCRLHALRRIGYQIRGLAVWTGNQ
jgi:hypothetical protein